ncbi:hypothetical protein A9Q84_07820 [Halobacteriovorax marinus]|uniref:SMP-30/Gluconolactonase/LRE-like region domain-containing protein n=1 Tax=Halobacteriovorax marinus TaxID=97084 RepID=A0A1Y5F5T9_9BACT|nr:hypothetical protein A9Q84_07820 [Halobacteriovorax marinus]
MKLILILSLLSIQTFAAKTESFELIYKGKNRFSPLIEMYGDTLIVADKVGTGQISLINTTSLNNVDVVNLDAGIISVTALHKEGWFAACYDMGNAAVLFHISNPEKKKKIYFGPESDYMCAGIDVTFEKNHPKLWIGSTFQRHILQYSFPRFTRPRITKKFDLISGPFRLKVRDNKVYTSNGLLMQRMPRNLPLILDAKSGNALAGSKLARSNETTLIREYGSNVTFDMNNKKAYYFRVLSNQLMQVDMNNPNENRLETIDLSIKFPRESTMYKKCQVVLGSHNDEQGKKLISWSVLKNGKEIQVIDAIDVTKFKYFSGQRIDSKGNVYLSSPLGVYRINLGLNLKVCR